MTDMNKEKDQEEKKRHTRGRESKRRRRKKEKQKKRTRTIRRRRNMSRTFENKKLNDLWKFDLKEQKWTDIFPSSSRSDSIEITQQPLERSGHSCALFGQYMVIFGGYFEVTKELNDLFLYDFENQKWIQIFQEVNSPISP